MSNVPSLPPSFPRFWNCLDFCRSKTEEQKKKMASRYQFPRNAMQTFRSPASSSLNFFAPNAFSIESLLLLPSLPLDCTSFPVYGGFIVKLPQRWLSLGTVLEGLGCVRKLVKGAHHHLQCHMMVWRVIIDMQFSSSFTKPCLTLSKPMYDTIWKSIPTGHPFFFTYGLTVLSMWDVAAIFPQLVM